MPACRSCGSTAGAVRFCSKCGAEQTTSGTASASADTLIGQMVAGRHQVLELIETGGGGRVYRAVQKPLERVVALKIIHPALLASDEAVTRFMEEARILSRLNHPNVVSVFDFGWSAPGDTGQLFLAMEYVTGPSLSTLLTAKQALPLRRLASIMGQVLAALSEAHHQGITHRDVKPDNIMLQPTRGGTDHVKVIDFGIAQSRERKRVTEFGRAIGTPEYMAPEQVRGEDIGPAADLYSLGVILFEALTGRRPFEGGSGVETMVRHLAAPRPDPRSVAPDRAISPELAAVCLRALSVDPAERYPDAATFAEALEQALPTQARGTPALYSARSRSSRPAPALSPPQAAKPRPLSREWTSTPVVEFQEAGPALAAGIELESAIFEMPLVGRSAELDWAIEQLVRDSGACVALCGRAGVGKTRLLRELCAAADGLDLRALVVTADPVPHCQVSFSAVKRMIVRLSGLSGAELRAQDTSDTATRDALRKLFPAEGTRVLDAQGAASTALQWSARRAVARAGNRNVVLVIDDADRADACSLAALSELVRQRAVPRFSVLMTGERLPDALIPAGVAVRGLQGLAPAQARELLADQGFARALPRKDDVEPLYVEGLSRWSTRDAAPVPETLHDLVTGRVRELKSAERRALLAIAVLGSACQAELQELWNGKSLTDCLKSLVEYGLVVRREGAFELAHPLYGRVVSELSPARVVADLHAAAADYQVNDGGELELQAFHAAKGRPDVEAFMLVEEVARVRRQHADLDGVAAILRLGLEAARSAMLNGEPNTVKPVAVFGRKLGSVLIETRRFDDAHGVLTAALALPGLSELERALLLEQLASVESTRGRSQEAERLRGECLAAAESCGDSEIIARVTNSGKMPPRKSIVTSGRSPFSASGGYQIRISDPGRLKS
ncbi:MAG TPA: protein kinase [Polyangiaceae bacterium]